MILPQSVTKIVDELHFLLDPDLEPWLLGNGEQGWLERCLSISLHKKLLGLWGSVLWHFHSDTLSKVQDLKPPSFLAGRLWSYFLILQMRNWDPKVWNQFSYCCPSWLWTEPDLECELSPYQRSSNPSWGADAHVEMWDAKCFCWHLLSWENYQSLNVRFIFMWLIVSPKLHSTIFNQMKKHLV